MPDHMEVQADAIAAVHVPRHARHVQRLAAVVAFDDRDHLGRERTFIHQTPDTEAGLQAKRDFGLHVRQFLLE